jgi:hypothetical protein
MDVYEELRTSLDKRARAWGLCNAHQFAQVVAPGRRAQPCARPRARPRRVAPPYRDTGPTPTVALGPGDREFTQLFPQRPSRWGERISLNINWENLMFKTTLAVGIVSLGVLGLSGCDVKKTQEGNVSVPKYEVEKKASGDVTLPKYDVTAPDVKVGTKDATVTVPTVKTEEKKIEVPTIDVTTGKEKNEQKKGG